MKEQLQEYLETKQEIAVYTSTSNHYKGYIHRFDELGIVIQVDLLTYSIPWYQVRHITII